MIGKLATRRVSETQVELIVHAGTILANPAGLLTFSSKWDANDFEKLIEDAGKPAPVDHSAPGHRCDQSCQVLDAT